jgi:glucose/mannose-6-phosphate isomerase
MDKLDDLKLIQELDSDNMLSHLVNFHAQLEAAQTTSEKLDLADYANHVAIENIENIVVSGMGGSAIGGDLTRALLASKCSFPIYVNRSYEIPAFVGKKTLFFAVSYSGNTEETLASFKVAKSKSAKLIAITSGGELKSLSEKASIPCVDIPSGYPPRCALGYLFIPILISLSKLGIVNREDISSQLIESARLLRELAAQFKPQAHENEKAVPKSLAYKVHGSLPIIYASNALEVVTLRWKGQICENAKSLAYSYPFPEMNHNEIEGWHFPEKLAKFCVTIFLVDSADHPRIKARMDITKKLIAEKVKEVVTLESKGISDLARMLYLIYIGDFTSFYLAILNGINPTPVDRIAQLKRELESITV